MNNSCILDKVAIIGAAGKMGSGIALLVADVMMRQRAAGERFGTLCLVDSSRDRLEQLRTYLETQLIKRAQRRGEDESAVQRFLEHGQCQMTASLDCELLADCNVVFEAVPEREELKIDILQRLGIVSKTMQFFSNTSSIPISHLNQVAELDGRIVGFHFYNPPAVQPLIELISGSTTRPELFHCARDLARQMGKTVVCSKDVAGFIGNGHFIREGLFAARCLNHFRGEFGEPEALYAVNTITERALLRPMGIFQVVDYAGIDIFVAILDVMDRFIDHESFSESLFVNMIKKGRLGGQYSNGDQKEGFFRYDGRQPVAVYDAEIDSYRALPGGSLSNIDAALGPLGETSWKSIRENDLGDESVSGHFKNLLQSTGTGARLALDFAKESRRIGKHLVAEGIACSEEDVNTVVVNGFHHLYGPMDDGTVGNL